MGGYAGRDWDKLLLPPFHPGKGVSDEEWRRIFGKTVRTDEGNMGEDKDGSKRDGMMERVQAEMVQREIDKLALKEIERSGKL